MSSVVVYLYRGSSRLLGVDSMADNMDTKNLYLPRSRAGSAGGGVSAALMVSPAEVVEKVPATYLAMEWARRSNLLRAQFWFLQITSIP
jgi:hypothetical protein